MIVSKQVKLTILIAILVALANTGNAQYTNIIKTKNMASYKDKGVAAPSEYFVGKVWINMNLTASDGYNTMIGTVNFEPEGRTNWHTHTCGQILFVTNGMGYYQKKGKPVQIIREGDVVKIPKNVEHWHGASHNSILAHIAIVPELNKDKTEWLNKVTDKQYNEGLQAQKPVEISLTNAAIKNHEELWPNYESKVAQTDPELIEIFDNWAFDEVIQKSGDIDTKTRAMMIMGSCIAQGALTEYKMFVNAGLNVGVTPVEVKEILYQSVAYVGVAKVIDFLYSANEIFKERDIQLPLEKQSTTIRENRHAKGLELMKSTFGDRIAEMREKAPDNQKHIQDFLAGNCFGDYYTRTGLNIKIRELLTYSMLISMGGTESQVKGHIQGNFNVGNDKQTLISITTQLLPYIGYPRTLNALTCLNEVLPESINK